MENLEISQLEGGKSSFPKWKSIATAVCTATALLTSVPAKAEETTSTSKSEYTQITEGIIAELQRIEKTDFIKCDNLIGAEGVSAKVQDDLLVSSENEKICELNKEFEVKYCSDRYCNNGNKNNDDVFKNYLNYLRQIGVFEPNKEILVKEYNNLGGDYIIEGNTIYKYGRKGEKVEIGRLNLNKTYRINIKDLEVLFEESKESSISNIMGKIFLILLLGSPILTVALPTGIEIGKAIRKERKERVREEKIDEKKEAKDFKNFLTASKGKLIPSSVPYRGDGMGDIDGGGLN